MSFNPSIIQKYGKAIAAAVGAIVVTISAFADGKVTPEEVTIIAASWATVAAVFGVTNG